MGISRPIGLTRTLVGFVLVASCGCSKPTPTMLTLAPAGMNPQGPCIADASGGVAFWGNGSLQSKAYLEKGPVTITMRARGNTVDGEAPVVLVDLEARVVGKLVIDSPAIKDFTFTTSAQDSGVAVLGITFSNHLAKPNPLEGRYLYIEMVSVKQAG